MKVTIVLDESQYGKVLQNPEDPLCRFYYKHKDEDYQKTLKWKPRSCNQQTI